MPELISPSGCLIRAESGGVSGAVLYTWYSRGKLSEIEMRCDCRGWRSCTGQDIRRGKESLPPCVAADMEGGQCPRERKSRVFTVGPVGRRWRWSLTRCRGSSARPSREMGRGRLGESGPTNWTGYSGTAEHTEESHAPPLGAAMFTKVGPERAFGQWQHGAELHCLVLLGTFPRFFF